MILLKRSCHGLSRTRHTVRLGIVTYQTHGPAFGIVTHCSTCHTGMYNSSCLPSCLFVFQMIPLTLTPGEARYEGPERHACILCGIIIITGTSMKHVEAWSVVLHRVTLTLVLRTAMGIYSVRHGMGYTRDPVFKSVFPCTAISTCIQHRGMGVYSVF